MTLIVKEQSEAPRQTEMILPKRYEFFATEVVKDVNDKNVTIPKSIGWFTVEQLEREKADLEKRIADIDEKLTAISEL